MSKVNAPQRFRIAGSAPVRWDPAGLDWWWTPARLEKLRYVMTKYGDVEKAARVLACQVRHAQYRWDKMNKGGAS